MPHQHSATAPGLASRPPTHDRASGGPKAPAGGPDAAGGPGLVHTQQVARADALTLENTAEARSHRRAARCKQRTITRARLLDEGVQRGGFRGRWLMVTFTYRDDVKWEARHAAEFWHRARQWFRRQKVELRYTWTMELTGRGRPHYHALVWIPRHLMLPQPDRRGWWSCGMTRTEVARNAVGYLAKYASKAVAGNPCDGDGNEMRFPRGARISGGSQLRGEARTEWRFWTAPKWARDRISPDGQVTDVRRVPGGYLEVATGEIHRPPWRFLGLSADGKQLLFAPRELEPCGA